MTIECDYEISASHPALPGHFPGNPVVPGVVLLSYVTKTLHEHCKLGLQGFPSVKFLRPLLPNQPFTVRLEGVDFSEETSLANPVSPAVNNPAVKGRFELRLADTEAAVLAVGKFTAVSLLLGLRITASGVAHG